MEAIQLEIGLELVPFVKTEDVKEGNLINSIRQMRRDTSAIKIRIACMT